MFHDAEAFLQDVIEEGHNVGFEEAPMGPARVTYHNEQAQQNHNGQNLLTV
jgi:hypothetical protein